MTPTFQSSQKTYLIASLIFLLIFISFSPVLTAGFVNWDDDVHLLKNPFVHALDALHLKDIFTTTVNKIYIPLTSLTFAVEYHFFKDWPFIYHLNNLLLHLCVTILMFFFAKEAGFDPRAAAVGAVVFGIHPMHAESVAWVTERKDVLYASFYLLSALSYLKFRKEEKAADYWFSLTFGGLSVLAKPMAVSLPFVLLLMDWFTGKKITGKVLLEKLPFVFLTGAVGWVTYSLHARIPAVDLFKSVLIWIWSFIFYLTKFFWPVTLVLIYKLPSPVSLSNPAYFNAVIFFFLVLAMIIFFKHYRVFLFAVLFYFCSIFFLLRFDGAGDTNIVADRFMYLPSLGICLWLGFLWSGLLKRAAGKRSFSLCLTLASIFILAFLSFRTFQQCRIWHDGVSLWSHQLEHQPQAAAALVMNQKAAAYFDTDEYREALTAPATSRLIAGMIHLFQAALQIKPDYSNAQYGLGRLYFDLGDDARASFYLNKSIKSDQNNFEALYLNGLLEQRMRHPDLAIKNFHLAIAANPNHHELRQRIFRALPDAAGIPDELKQEKSVP